MATYDAVAAEYVSFYAAQVYLDENARLLNLLTLSITRSGQTLDLGCGTGFLVDLLAIPPHRYTGIDVSEGMLAEAQRKHEDHIFLNEDMETLPPGWTGLFGNVVCLFEPMNQTADPSRALGEAVRVLRTGGRLFIMLTTVFHTQSDILRARGISVYLNEFSALEAVKLSDGALERRDVVPFSDSYEVLRAVKV